MNIAQAPFFFGVAHLAGLPPQDANRPEAGPRCTVNRAREPPGETIGKP